MFAGLRHKFGQNTECMNVLLKTKGIHVDWSIGTDTLPGRNIHARMLTAIRDHVPDRQLPRTWFTQDTNDRVNAWTRAIQGVEEMRRRSMTTKSGRRRLVLVTAYGCTSCMALRKELGWMNDKVFSLHDTHPDHQVICIVSSVDMPKIKGLENVVTPLLIEFQQGTVVVIEDITTVLHQLETSSSIRTQMNSAQHWGVSNT